MKVVLNTEINGKRAVIEFESAEDAARFMRLLGGPLPVAQVPAPPRRRGKSFDPFADEAPRDASADAAVMNAIVSLLRGAGSDGVPANEVQTAVRAPAPAALRYSLEALARAARGVVGARVKYDDLIVRKKVRGRMKWFPGTRFHELDVRLRELGEDANKEKAE